MRLLFFGELVFTRIFRESRICQSLFQLVKVSLLLSGFIVTVLALIIGDVVYELYE